MKNNKAVFPQVDLTNETPKETLLEQRINYILTALNDKENKGFNGVFWTPGESGPDEYPFKGSTIFGTLIITREEKLKQHESSYIVNNRLKTTKISQFVIIDIVEPDPKNNEGDEAWLENLHRRDAYKDKKSVCESRGIFYICDYHPARIYDKILFHS
jgi:hypothetical protein